MLIFCIVSFFIGILVSGLAKNFTDILVGRTIQGVGAGGILTLAEIIITDIVPLRQRGVYFGMIGGVWAFGSVSGPVIGGAFAQNVSWVSLFKIFVSISLLLEIGT